MPRTYAFDVYGTLIDPLGISRRLHEIVGEPAARIALAWREKQLEYLFRRGLMRRYASFSVCTRQAFEFACTRFGVKLDEEHTHDVLSRYRELPAYPDAMDTLDALRDSDHRLFAFSNGEPDELEALLEHAGLRVRLRAFSGVHRSRG